MNKEDRHGRNYLAMVEPRALLPSDGDGPKRAACHRFFGIQLMRRPHRVNARSNDLLTALHRTLYSGMCLQLP